MAKRYGPWATLIDAGGNPQLSAFWRRRLSMLVSASQTSPVLSRRHLAWLSAALVLTMVLPTFRSAPAVAEEEKAAAEGKIVVTHSTAETTDAPDDPDKKPTIVQMQTESIDRRTLILTLPDGSTRPMTITTTTVSSGGDKGRHEEMNKLIAEKRYRLLKTYENPDGQTQYVYQLTFSDGSHVNKGFSMPLECAASWDDYQQKDQQQQRQRQEKITKAIAAGTFRLINLEVMQSHLCRDVSSNQAFKVQRIPLHDGTEIAHPRADIGELPASVKRTSWQEHLQAIREGKRELLDLRTVRSYTYEVFLDDGTKTLFNYGGDQPLKKPEKKDP